MAPTEREFFFPAASSVMPFSRSHGGADVQPSQGNNGRADGRPQQPTSSEREPRMITQQIEQVSDSHMPYNITTHGPSDFAPVDDLAWFPNFSGPFAHPFNPLYGPQHAIRLGAHSPTAPAEPSALRASTSPPMTSAESHSSPMPSSASSDSFYQARNFNYCPPAQLFEPSLTVESHNFSQSLQHAFGTPEDIFPFSIHLEPSSSMVFFNHSLDYAMVPPGSMHSYEAPHDHQNPSQALNTSPSPLDLFREAVNWSAVSYTGPFIPQPMFRPHSAADIRRYVEGVHLQPPIRFLVEHPDECGIPLSDALHSRVRRLIGRDQSVFEGRGPVVSIRLEWPGYGRWSRQIPTKDFRSPPRLITQAKLVKNVARCIERFIKDRHNSHMEADSDGRWRVRAGPGRGISFDDIVLVSLHHVAQGSWQPQLRLRRPLN